MRRFLILGIGNVLLMDEGVGVRAVERFRDLYDVPDTVEIVDGGTAGMDLIDVIEGHDVVVVLDALRCGRGPGTVVVLDEGDVPAVFRQGLSPHQLGLPDVLAAMALLDLRPPRLIVVGTEPVEIRPGIGLSPALEAMIPEILAAVVAQLRRLDVPVREKGRCEGDFGAAPAR